MEDLKKTKPSYFDEFKDDAVTLAESSSKPLTQVAREIGVSESTFRAWVEAKQVSPARRAAPKVHELKPKRQGSLARSTEWMVSLAALAGVLAACGSAGTPTSAQHPVSTTTKPALSQGAASSSTSTVAAGSSCTAIFGPASIVAAEFHASGPLVLHGSGGSNIALECYYSLASGSSFPVLRLLVGKYVSRNAPAFGRAPNGIAASASAIQPTDVTVGPANDA